MQKVALLYHPYKPRAVELTRQWSREIVDRGAPAPLIASAWDEREAESICGRADLVITLGGDGTLLRAVRIGARCGVPAIGVKLGQVGFLSAIRPEEFSECIGPLLDGKFWVEERLMVRAQLIRGGETIGTYDAINDVVVSRGKLARVIRVHIAIDGETLQTFAADGAIVATATGSTAYSLAAGGPILAPMVRTLLLTLIAPYLSPIHSLVLPDGAHVTMRVQSPLQAMLTIDGQYDTEVKDGDIVETEASPLVARLAQMTKPTHFFTTLLHRLREDGMG